MACKCNSPTDNDFARNIYYGESYFMKTRRTVKIRSIDATDPAACLLLVSNPDGSVSDDPVRVDSRSREVIQYISFDKCASSSPSKIIRLQLS